VVHLGRAHGVQQDVDLDPGGGPFAQGVGELRRDGAGPVHVGGEVDRLLGLLDRLQHGREDLGAVAEHGDPVALAQRGDGERLNQAGEVGRARCRRVLQLEALAGGAPVLGRLKGVDRGEPKTAQDRAIADGPGWWHGTASWTTGGGDSPAALLCLRSIAEDSPQAG
jgi:hypothetical protein